MDSYQITYLFDHVDLGRFSFAGVFPAGGVKVSELPSPPYVLIMNTAPASHAGVHWTAISCTGRNKRVEFFDPLGMKANDLMTIFLSKLGERYYWSKNIIQAPTSNICALYCVLYCFYRAHGFSFKTFVNIFKKNSYYLNDCKAIKMYEQVFNSKIKLTPLKKTRSYCRKSV